MAIGGSDSGAGAGVQADLKTLSAHGVFATTVITTVTAQNTRGVKAAEPMAIGLIAAQMKALLADLPPDAVKDRSARFGGGRPACRRPRP